MSHNSDILNKFLVSIFEDILKIQENSLKEGKFSDLSLNKLHILEKICDSETGKMTDIAEVLGITLGSLTVAVDALEKRGYVIKERSLQDKRIVLAKPTTKALTAYEEHREFHKKMVDGIVRYLSEDELDTFAKGIEKLGVFFQDMKRKSINGE